LTGPIETKTAAVLSLQNIFGGRKIKKKLKIIFSLKLRKRVFEVQPRTRSRRCNLYLLFLSVFFPKHEFLTLARSFLSSVLLLLDVDDDVDDNTEEEKKKKQITERTRFLIALQPVFQCRVAEIFSPPFSTN
jgi:hypothetical protein